MYIRNFGRTESTVISNRFIDGAMTKANGEYVKVYLYLLRMAQDPGEDIRVADLADRLEDTEKDVLRALRYWENEGWLRLIGEKNGREAEGIELTDPGAAMNRQNTAADRRAAERAAGDARRAESGGTVLRDAQSADHSGASDTEVPDSERTGEGTADPGDERQAMKESGRKPGNETGDRAAAEVRTLTPETMEQLEKDDEFRQFTFVAEMYLNRTLTPKDIQLFAYLYDILKFPEDLMEYLVEYCVGGGHRSCRYMETVALNWHQEGKMTVQLAKESQKAYSRENKAVMKAFGITGRVLSDSERSYVEKWTKEYGFSTDLIAEACNTTMAAIQRPSFQYTDTILTDWHDAGVHTPEEAKLRKESRKNGRQAAREQKAGEEKKPAGGESRFHNYQQRAIDYDALLKQGGLNPYGED